MKIGMDSVVRDIIGVVSEWHTGWQVFGVLLVMLFAAFSMLKDFRQAVIEVLRSGLHITTGNPEKHPFFAQENLMLAQIGKIDFGDEDKNRLFRILLRNKVRITYARMREYVKSKEWRKRRKIELQAQLLLLIDSIPKEYEEKTRRDYIVEYKDRGEKLFELIYNSPNGFRQYHQKNIDIIQHNTRKIFLVQGFDNQEVINSFLLQVWIALDVAITDCVITFDGVNGNIRRIVNCECSNCECSNCECSNCECSNCECSNCEW